MRVFDAWCAAFEMPPGPLSRYPGPLGRVARDQPRQGDGLKSWWLEDGMDDVIKELIHERDKRLLRALQDELFDMVRMKSRPQSNDDLLRHKERFLKELRDQMRKGELELRRKENEDMQRVHCSIVKKALADRAEKQALGGNAPRFPRLRSPTLKMKQMGAVARRVSTVLSEDDTNAFYKTGNCMFPSLKRASNAVTHYHTKPEAAPHFEGAKEGNILDNSTLPPLETSVPSQLRMALNPGRTSLPLDRRSRDHHTVPARRQPLPRSLSEPAWVTARYHKDKPGFNRSQFPSGAPLGGSAKRLPF